MKNLFKRLPKKVIATTLLSLAVAFGVTAAGIALLGGDRPVKTYNGPGTEGFDHVTFNSFTNVPNIGDERNFVTGKIAGAPNGFYDPMNGVENGDEILVRVYVHNGADPKYNTAEEGYKGIAKNTRVRVQLPTGSSKDQATHAFVSADNAQPQIVEDTLNMNSKYPVSLKYVPGSAAIKTNFQERALSDNIVSDGVLIGDDSVNGDLKGCFEYVALVTFKVKVVAPSWTIDKKVRLSGTDTYTDTIQAQPGQKVDYAIAFKNVGTTDLKNVVVGDRLPKGVTYQQDSTYWNSGHTNNKWVKAPSNNITTGGVNIGAYAPNGAAYLRFTAQLPSADELECGVNRLVNLGFVKPGDQGTTEDDATVIIDKECEQPEAPTYSCKLIDVETPGNRKVIVKTTPAFTGNVQVTGYEYNFGDGSEPLVTDQKTVSYTYEKDGTYHITAKVNFTVDGQAKDGVTSESCQTNVTFTSGQPETPETPETPTELPNTGPSGLVAVVAAVSAGATMAYQFMLRRQHS